MNLPVVRPVRGSDFKAISALAHQAGGGMTNLPTDAKALGARIDATVAAYARGASEPGGEIYLFALELDGAILGTCGVFSAIGLDHGFVNYRVNREFYASKELGTRIVRRVLVPTHDFTGCAEVGSLFLSPNARGGGFGKLIARARYMFIAQSPKIVAEHICAELRGWRSKDGATPFWEAVGRHFFEMEFEAADLHNSTYGNQFIEDMLPRYPIYAALLPKEARECIGKPHEAAAPAYKMLLDEGFEFNNYVDIFDGGPVVDTVVANIRTIRESRVLTVADVEEVQGGDDALLAAGAVASFRCTRAKAEVEGDRITIDKAAAAALNVEAGAKLRWCAW